MRVVEGFRPVGMLEPSLREALRVISDLIKAFTPNERLSTPKGGAWGGSSVDGAEDRGAGSAT